MKCAGRLKIDKAFRRPDAGDFKLLFFQAVWNEIVQTACIYQMTNPTSSKQHWSHTAAVASLAGLIAVSLAWELWLAPLRPGGSWLALKALPLCLPLAGIL